MASFKQVLSGLEILSKYVDVNSLDQIDAQHDEIFAAGDVDVSPEDAARLNEYGWQRVPELGWRKFT